MNVQYVINGAGEPVSVIVPVAEYRALSARAEAHDETEYLLRSPENAARLRRALEDVKAGRNIEARELLPDD
jgi:PHD/YefM family antitoxin component YafN of YafNO toxin-antitoxin module